MIKDMTQGSPSKLIFNFALSMMMTAVLSYVYALADSVMVSWFVEVNALGAVSVVSQITSFSTGLMSGTISGFAVLLGKAFGAGDRERMRRMMANIFYISTAIVIFGTAFLCIFGRWLLVLTKTPSDLMDLAYAYMMVSNLGNLVFFVSWIFSSVFRSLGDSRTPFLISALCGGMNVIFNYLFLRIIPLGTAGAALGTVCASAVGGGLYIFFFIRRMKILHFSRREASLSFRTIGSLLGIGLPMGLQSSITAVGALILQTAVNSHGSTAVNGVSTGGKALSLVWYILYFESALVYFSAQNCGAGRIDRVRKGIRSAFFFSLIWSGALALFFVFFGKYYYMFLVGDSPEIIAIAQRYFLTQVVFFPFMATLVTGRGALQGIGYTLPAVFCGVTELISRTVVSVFFTENLNVLFFAGPLAWVTTSIFLVILLPKMLWRVERKLAASAANPAGGGKRETEVAHAGS